MAITTWSSGGDRNVVLRADNQNVLRWAEHARAQSPVPNRILKALNAFCLRHGVEVFPAYVRGEHDAYADGLTRRPHPQLEDWVTSEGMSQVDAASRLWAGMSLSYNPDAEASPPPNTFALLGNILHFFRSYNYRVCEWRPIRYAVDLLIFTRESRIISQIPPEGELKRPIMGNPH